MLTVSAAPAPCDEQKKATQTVNAEKYGCHVEGAAKHLVIALTKMEKDSVGREQVYAALKTLSKLGPQAETRIAALCSEAGLCTKKDAVAQVNAVKSQCSKSDKVAVVADVKAQCSKSDKVAVVADVKAQCSKSDKVAVVADAKAQCSKSDKVAVVAAGAQCSKSDKVALVGADKAQCCKEGALAAGEVCCKEAKAKAALAAGSACCAKGDKAKQARFVAFGCEKSDRLARVAAQSYINLLMEMKKMYGAEGCPVEAATKVLASIAEEIEGERVAKTDAAPEAATVSFGAVSDKPACSKKN
jgi:hypothetical protein